MLSLAHSRLEAFGRLAQARWGGPGLKIELEQRIKATESERESLRQVWKKIRGPNTPTSRRIVNLPLCLRMESDGGGGGHIVCLACGPGAVFKDKNGALQHLRSGDHCARSVSLAEV